MLYKDSLCVIETRHLQAYLRVLVLTLIFHNKYFTEFIACNLFLYQNLETLFMLEDKFSF